jgi:hypothetical protein
MRRPVCPDNQIDIFPRETMERLFAHPIVVPPKLDLPFPRNAEISSERVAEILDISVRTLGRLLDRGLLRHYEIDGGLRNHWRIEFASLVQYCNTLREQADMPPCKLPGKGLRPRAEDLLPFPKADTVDIDFVADKLDCGRTMVLQLVQAGRLRAYRLYDWPAVPWRIDVRSLETYIQGLHSQAHKPALTPSASRR